MADEVTKTDEKGESKAEPELDLDSLFSPPKEGVDTDEADVKESADEADTSSSEESVDTDPKELQAKVSALTKELSRVRKGKAESSGEVQELREQLANMQGQLEVMSKGKATDEVAENRLAKYTDEQLLQGQTEWEDAVGDYKDAQRRARADSDDTAFTKAVRDSNTAKSTLIAIRKELMDRSKRVGAEQARAQSETSELVTEIAGLYDNAYDKLPALKDKESDLWKAGNEVYNRHPKLMKTLGPMAELVATSIALSENPELLPKGKTGKEVRKELLTEINSQAEKSLLKGKGTTNKRVTTNFAEMPKDQFEAVIRRLKRGE